MFNIKRPCKIINQAPDPLSTFNLILYAEEKVGIPPPLNISILTVFETLKNIDFQWGEFPLLKMKTRRVVYFPRVILLHGLYAFSTSFPTNREVLFYDTILNRFILNRICIWQEVFIQSIYRSSFTQLKNPMITNCRFVFFKFKWMYYIHLYV